MSKTDVRMAFAFATFVMETESASLCLQASTIPEEQSRALLHIAKAALLLKKLLKLGTPVLSAEPKVQQDVLVLSESVSEKKRTVRLALNQSGTYKPITLTVLSNDPKNTGHKLPNIKVTPSNTMGSCEVEPENAPYRRRLEVTGLNILSQRRFETHIELTRNSKVIVEEEEKPPLPINKEFIYSLPAICSFEPVYPRLDQEHEIVFDGSPHPIAFQVQRLIKGLVSEIANETDEQCKKELLIGIVCDIAVNFEPEIVKGLTCYGGKCIKILPDFPLSPDAAQASANTALAEEIKKWLDNYQPFGWGTQRPPDPPGSLVFDVKIYERSKNQQILRLQRCVLPLKKVTTA